MHWQSRNYSGLGCGRRTGLALLLTMIAACSGSTGERGPAGPSGPPGVPPPVDIADADAVLGEIDEVTIASPPVMTFRLADSRGTPITGLTSAAVSFTIAKLLPGSDGNPSAWQSYINTVEKANGIGPGSEDQVQAATENGGPDQLVDHGDGSYTYTYSTDVGNVAGIPFEPQLTHRAGFEIRGFGAVPNPVYTFKPANGATTNLFSREIVSDASCNRCHEQIQAHGRGEGRYQLQYCVTCHNPGSADAQSGNTVDLTAMIHKIHRGSELPSVQAGGEYALWGRNDVKYDYSGVVYPQDIRNCRNCHDEDDPQTPDAANWYLLPSIEGCGSCHDDLDYSTGENHPGGVAANGDCLICHAGDSALRADRIHRIAEQEAAGKYRYDIVDIAGVSPGATAQIQFTVTNPATGVRYDIQNDPAFTQGFGASRLAIDIAWDTPEINNTGSNSGSLDGAPAQPISIDLLFGGASGDAQRLFTATADRPIPANAKGSGIVVLEGHPAENVDGQAGFESLPVTTVTRSFAITDGIARSRRSVVELQRCNDCHQQLSAHGANRNDNITACLACHNPDATDLQRRVQGGADSSNSPDGKDEATVNLKDMIHAIHAGTMLEQGYVAYSFFGSPVEFGDVVYPGRLANCNGCHRPGTYYPVGPFARATTIDSGADLDDPLDDLNITPNTAACFSCHDSAAAAAHMVNEGGAFDAMQAADGTLISVSHGTVIETCDLCHGPGRSADAGALHGIE